MTTTAVRVPYITAYSEELAPHPLAFVAYPEATDGVRLSYDDAVPQDWMYGVLWARQGLHRRGRPEWKVVNTLRQRRCMRLLLCQVCGESATDPVDSRISWVLADDPGDTSAGAGYTNAPPTCAQCIPEAIASCPRLRRGAAVYSVGSAQPYGIIGDVSPDSLPVAQKIGALAPNTQSGDGKPTKKVTINKVTIAESPSSTAGSAPTSS